MIKKNKQKRMALLMTAAFLIGIIAVMPMSAQAYSGIDYFSGPAINQHGKIVSGAVYEVWYADHIAHRADWSHTAGYKSFERTDVTIEFTISFPYEHVKLWVSIGGGDWTLLALITYGGDKEYSIDDIPAYHNVVLSFTDMHRNWDFVTHYWTVTGAHMHYTF